jgi:DNA-binding response OmpR family regulator
LPRNAPAPSSKEKALSVDLSGKNILIVDDDPDLLTAMSTSLAETKATVETASDGAQAVERAQQIQPDLVVLDIMLPQKSGFLVLERLQQMKEKRPKVVMITGNQGRRHRQYAEALGVNEYLNKPFRMDALIEAAEKLLKNS